MASHDDDQDLVVYGTPIEREEDVSARKRRGVAEAGQLRTLPAWKQEVRDEEGRRRFHGAFTGGFSAGFYNTAGSKDGWTPQTFTSSRNSRAEHKKQNIYNFLDEEDIKDMGGNALETSQQYDTFGFTAAEHARKQASKEQNERPSAIPGPVPDEFVVPATTSIGVKLLMKMGWRQGRTIKDAHADSLYESRREARKAFLALSGISNNDDQDKVSSQKSRVEENVAESIDDMRASGNTPVYVLHPKEDLHGLGFDPFKHAPEFKDRKRSQKSVNRDRSRSDVSVRGSLLISNSGQYAPGFGIGALEELGVEDEDIYASGFSYELTEVDIEPSKTAGDSKFKLEDKKRGFVLSFKIASNSEYKLERFHPPEIPADFDGHHKFSSPIQAADKFSDPAPPEVPPPEDSTLRLLIDGCAAMVARCGKHIEDFYKEKSKASPQFLFLDGGDGCSYYARKLWEHQQKFIGQQRPDSVKSKPSSDKLTAENRGNILGERPLDRSSKSSSTSFSAKAVQLQSNLGDTFVKPISLDGVPESKKPFRNEPAKQARFEQFLKEKYQGGLRIANLVPTSSMSEADRARERLDFEAAADAIEKGKEYKAIDPISLLGLNEERFVSSTQLESSAVPRDEKPVLPQREEFEWRPSPILCKRFDIVDPFMGKPMPLRRPISKMDSLMFMTESTKRTNDDVKSSSGIPQNTSAGGIEQTEAQGAANEPEIVPSSVERPVDLYKAIFSDDSDDDMDEPLNNKPVDPVKTSEGANMALNRLVAEDFLESLGKELGLEVPAEKPIPPLNVFRSEILPTADRSVSRNEKTTTCREIKENEGPFDLMEASNANGDGPSSNIKEVDSKYEKQEHRAEKGRSHSSRRQIRNGCTESDTDNERHRSRKRRSHHKTRSPTPDSDSSGERRRSKKRKSHSRHRTGRSRTPDVDLSSDSQKNKRKRQEKRSHRTLTPDIDSSDHEYKEKYTSSSRRSSDKDRSRKRSRHRRHRREDPA